MRSRIGIIAGGGALPRAAADAVVKSGGSVFIVVLDGHGAPEHFHGLDHVICRVGGVGSILSALHTAGVVDVCLVGTVKRPSLGQLRPDKKALGLIARHGFGALGDDALLRTVGHVLSTEGFTLIGVQDLISDVLLKGGPAGRFSPTQEEIEDIRKGLLVARTLGTADVGQSVVIQQGVILAVEAAEGTDRLISRVGDLVFPGRRPILVKACKPQQDRRLDLPTIGPTTVLNATVAHFAGIASEAGKTLVADMETVRHTADQAGIFVFGISMDDNDAGR